jgi:hypothetical protein
MKDCWPFGAVLRGMVSNRHMLRWLTTVVVSDVEKAAEEPSGGDQECDVMSRGASGCSGWRIGGVDTVAGRVSRRSSRRGMRSG